MQSFFLKPWFFLSLGVIMSVASAVVSNFLIVRNNTEIEKAQMELSHMEQTIDYHWENYRALERKEDLETSFIILVNQENNPSAIRAAIKRYIEGIVRLGALTKEEATTLEKQFENPKEIAEGVNFLSRSVDRYRKNATDMIDELYIKQTGLERQKMEIVKRNNILRNIALFLQIMGLILVVSKDAV